MLKRSSLFIAVSLFFVVAVSAQSASTPKEGSAERKAILNAIRVPVEKDLKQKVVFVVDHIKTQGSWAFVSGRPQKPSGGRIDLEGTMFEGHEDIFDDNFFGLLRKRGGKCRVVTHALGCTDVCYATWWSDHKAPKSIFPYTE